MLLVQMQVLRLVWHVIYQLSYLTSLSCPLYSEGSRAPKIKLCPQDQVGFVGTEINLIAL